MRVYPLYKEGHAGISFLIYSPFMFTFKFTGADMSYVLMTGILMAIFSITPDIDLHFEIKHRGITHTLLFGIVLGAFLGILLRYAYEPLGLLMGFIAGFGGTVSHLLGDLLTYSPFKPLYPFSNREVALGLFKASNKVMNATFFVLGVFTFLISYQPAIFLNILASI
ncbi:MAG: metal-dependent hydrolase [Candidatus Bathyarchaeia archaeon]